MNILIWIVQGLLAAVFLATGSYKVFTPLDQLAAQMAWAADVPGALTRFIGLCEILGAVGLILPAATRIQAWLTPMAASSLSMVMVLAVGTHLAYAEYAGIPPVLGLLALSVFVAWGRFVARPIPARGARETLEALESLSVEKIGQSQPEIRPVTEP